MYRFVNDCCTIDRVMVSHKILNDVSVCSLLNVLKN